MFELVKAQRPIVRSLARVRWPTATEEFLEALESAVAFEADTHMSLAPTLETVWLDQGRPLPYQDAIERYAPDRISVYASYVPPTATAFDSALLTVMSIESWNRIGARPEGGTERDPKFAEAIVVHPSSSSAEWAIAIVGAHHASRDARYMVQLLEAQGISCVVSELRPQHNAA